MAKRKRNAPIGADVTVFSFSIADAARATGISRSELYQRISDGIGPKIIKLGRRTLIRVVDLEAWLANMPAGVLTKPTKRMA